MVGSTVHGLNVRDAVEDRDEMGVLVEPFDAVVGFTRFEQFIYRSAAERGGRADAKSGAGDLDLVIYSLRKYVRLCLTGNPTMMLPLYAPPDAVITCTPLGEQLRALAPLIASRRAGYAFSHLTVTRVAGPGRRRGLDAARLPPRLGRGRRALRSVAPDCRFGYDRRSARWRARLAQW